MVDARIKGSKNLRARASTRMKRCGHGELIFASRSFRSPASGDERELGPYTFDNNRPRCTDQIGVSNNNNNKNNCTRSKEVKLERTFPTAALDYVDTYRLIVRAWILFFFFPFLFTFESFLCRRRIRVFGCCALFFYTRLKSSISADKGCCWSIRLLAKIQIKLSLSLLCYFSHRPLFQNLCFKYSWYWQLIIVFF